MGLMYEVPSFGRTYFEGDTAEHAVVVGVGVAGVQLLNAGDEDRPVLAEYGFNIIGSFVCSDEARSARAWFCTACSRVAVLGVIPQASLADVLNKCHLLGSGVFEVRLVQKVAAVHLAWPKTTSPNFVKPFSAIKERHPLSRLEQ